MPPTPTAAYKRCCALVRDGATWRAAAAACNVPYGRAYIICTRVMPELRGRRPRIAEATREAIRHAIEHDNVAYKAIAQRFRVSKDTVSRYARKMREQYCASVGFEVRNVARRLCSGCGNHVTLEPCVLCCARAAKRKA